MKNRALGIALLLGVALVVLALDQLSKAWIVENLLPKGILPIWEGVVRLRYTENTGAAFGIFQGGTGALSIAAIAIIVAIIVSAGRIGGGSPLAMLALGLVLGGAIGNLVDRLRLGYVVDFVELTLLRANINNTVYTFPVFNVADSAITVGVILLILTLLFGKHEHAPAAAPAAAPGKPLHRAESWQPTIRNSQSEVRTSPAGWAGLALLLGGFLLLAFRTARSQE